MMIVTFTYSSLVILGCPLEVTTGLGWTRGGGGGALRGGGGGGGSLSLSRATSISLSKSTTRSAPRLVASQPTLRGQSQVWSSWLEFDERIG